jgi:competence protein ComEA
MDKWKEFLRRGGVPASLLCFCIALGFFLGSVYDRRSASPVRVVARTPAETVPPDPEPVNINTAEAEALETLPGIGPALARRILEYREANGPFRYLYELMDVEGIGDEVFDGLRGRITLD